MPDNLYLRLGTAEVEWLLLDDISDVVRVRGKGSFEEFVEMTADLTWSGGVYAMIPGENVLLTSAAVPSKQKRQILQAVPYMVEERLATEVEDCHFAIGDRREDGEIGVAVLDHDYLATWLARLKEANIYPRSITPDVLLVPRESAATVMVDGERVLVRTGTTGGFCVEKSLFPTIATLLTNTQRAGLTVLVHPDEEEQAQLQLTQIHLEGDKEPDVRKLEYTPFEALCRHYDRDALNLLQGEFRVEEETGTNTGAWRSAAILAGCAFLLHLLLVTAQGIYLDVKGRHYEARATELYRDVFPNDRNVRDMRRRWQAHLSGQPTDGSADFLNLFRQTAKNLPGSRLVLNNVNYNESRGDMILQLQAPNSDQLVAFSQTLSKIGLQADVGTISQDADRVNGSIKVSLGGGRS